MCGRTSLFIPQEDLEDRFDARVVADDGYQPRFNIAPGDPLEVITNAAPDAIDRYTWGLVPDWMDDPDEGFINARSETAHEKPSFQDAMSIHVDTPVRRIIHGQYVGKPRCQYFVVQIHAVV